MAQRCMKIHQKPRFVGTSGKAECEKVGVKLQGISYSRYARTSEIIIRLGDSKTLRGFVPHLASSNPPALVSNISSVSLLK